MYIDLTKPISYTSRAQENAESNINLQLGMVSTNERQRMACQKEEAVRPRLRSRKTPDNGKQLVVVVWLALLHYGKA